MAKVFKLVSGEIVICNSYKVSEPGVIRAEKPHVIQLSMGQNNKPEVSFYPYKHSPFAQNLVPAEEGFETFKEINLMSFEEANDEITKFYKQMISPIIQTNTGLILP